MKKLLVVLALLGSASVLAADDPKKLTPEERKQLETKLQELLQAGDKAYQAGKLQEAGKAWDELISVARQLYPKDVYPDGHNQLVTSLLLRALVYHKQRQLVEAEPLYREALGFARKLYPPSTYPYGLPQLDACLSNLADILGAQEKYAEAEPVLRESLAVQRALYPSKKFPDGHKSISDTLNNLAVSLEKLGKSADAEKFYRDALEMKRALFPRDNPPGVDDDLFRGIKNLALALQRWRRFAESEQLFRDALALRETQYGNEKFPLGHPELATSHGDLAAILEDQGRFGAAERAFRDAIDMRRKIYAKEPFRTNHPELAIDLNNLARVLRVEGKLAVAELCYREALEIARKQALGGQPLLASVLNNIAATLQDQGKFLEAEAMLRESLALKEKLFSSEKFPEGHPELAGTRNNLGLLLHLAGDDAEAERVLQAAVKMQQTLHIADDDPQVASYLNNLSVILTTEGKFDDADQMASAALAIRKRLYPEDKFPEGHADLTASTNNLASLARARGNAAVAVQGYRDAVTMDRRLFPKDLFPSGHPNLIRDLNNLATALREVGDNLEADKTYRAALSARRSLIRSFATEKPEGEALTFLASAPATRDGFLTNASILRSEPADIYAEIWLEKGQLARVYEQRHQVARAAAGDPKTASLLAQLFQARRGRAELLAAPIAQDPATRKKREEDLGKYEKQIADLNGELRPLLTELEGTEMLGSATPKDLQKAIPVDAVVVDYLSYWHFDQTERTTDVPAHDKLTKSYLAFVITRASIAWLDLGPAKPIEAAIVAWREAIINGDAIPPELPAKVRELVWTKVRNEIPSGTNVVYVAPDLSLCRLPWSALPGDNPGTILVEDFAIATIPYTGFLLDQLSRHELRKKSPTLTLVVGGVKYDAELKTPDPKSVAEPPVKPGAKLGPWRELAEATAEADGMVKAARNKKLEVQKLDGEKATVAALLAELPKARITHIVTHGFFADPLFRSDFHLDEREFKMAARGERIGRAALSPLVMTGLVLAGANRPETPGRGIVTGESLIDLDLSGLELAVLSACETGLGDVAGGEGVFGLQRAFHMAGTRDVIASLWKVNDAATAALMGEFYRALWDDKLEPVFALQKAQLAVYRADPKNFREMARRGLGWGDKPFDPDKLHINDDGKNSPALWAAFTLSGPGRSDPSATESRASAEAPETDSIESQSSGAIETSHTPERNKSWSPWILPTAIAVASVFIILTTLIAAAVCGRLLARRATKS